MYPQCGVSGDSSVGRRGLERCKIERKPIGEKHTLGLCKSDNCECVKSGKQRPAHPPQTPPGSALPLCRRRRRPCSTTFAVFCNIFRLPNITMGDFFWSRPFVTHRRHQPHNCATCRAVALRQTRALAKTQVWHCAPRTRVVGTSARLGRQLGRKLAGGIIFNAPYLHNITWRE